ncbi:uncharacterized protein LOC143136465 [Alosa pseudoharengus]|uniref:uncharacterized protein LOC143136465 n=1 Tax=Alosa pseudoharengus TaxID=34774 RepID=UPI003F8B0CA8
MTSPRFLKTTIVFCLIFSLFHGGSSITITAATNGNVTLQLLMEGQIDEILWKHKGNKMVEWEKTNNPTEYLTFKGRTKLDFKTGKVTIVKLTKDDSGEYEAEVLIGGLLKTVKRFVKVIDPVTEAKITCNSSASTATLYCEADGDLLSFSWSGPGLQKEMRGQAGPQITKENNQNSVYTCVVNNIINNINVAYNASDCFTADAGNCHMITSVLCGIAGVAVAVAVAGGIYYYKRNSSVGQNTHKQSQEVPSSDDADENTAMESDIHPEGTPLLRSECNDESKQTSTKDSKPLRETDDTPKDISKSMYKGQEEINASGGSRKDGEPASATKEKEDAESLRDTEDTLSVPGLTPNDDSSGDQISPDAKATHSSPEKDVDFEEPTSSEKGKDAEPTCIDKTDQNRTSDQTVDVKTTPDVPTEGPDFRPIDLKGVKNIWANHDIAVQNEHAPLKKNKNDVKTIPDVPAEGPDYRPIDLKGVKNIWANHDKATQNSGNVQNAESNSIGPKTGDGLHCKESTLSLNPVDKSDEEKMNAKEEKDPGSSCPNKPEEHRSSDGADDADMKTAMESDVPTAGTPPLRSERNDEHKQSQEEVPLVDDESKQTSTKDSKPLGKTDDTPKDVSKLMYKGQEEINASNGSQKDQISPDTEATLSSPEKHSASETQTSASNQDLTGIIPCIDGEPASATKEKEDAELIPNDDSSGDQISPDAKATHSSPDMNTAMESDVPTAGTPPLRSERNDEHKQSQEEVPLVDDESKQTSTKDSKPLGKTDDTPKDVSKLMYKDQEEINASNGSQKDQISPDTEATLSSPEKHSASETQTSASNQDLTGITPCIDGEPASATKEKEDAELIPNDDSSGDQISPDAKATHSSPDMNTAMESDVPTAGTPPLRSERNDEHKQSQEEVPLVDDESKQTSTKDSKPLGKTDDTPKDTFDFEEPTSSEKGKDAEPTCIDKTDQNRTSDQTVDVKTTPDVPTEGPDFRPIDLKGVKNIWTNHDIAVQNEHAPLKKNKNYVKTIPDVPAEGPDYRPIDLKGVKNIWANQHSASETQTSASNQDLTGITPCIDGEPASATKEKEDAELIPNDDSSGDQISPDAKATHSSPDMNTAMESDVPTAGTARPSYTAETQQPKDSSPKLPK